MPGMWENLAPVMAVGFIMLIPIMKILTRHQQNMATIMRADRQALGSKEDHILHELAALRELVVQQSLAIERLRDEQRVLTQGAPPVMPIEADRLRLGGL